MGDVLGVTHLPGTDPHPRQDSTWSFSPGTSAKDLELGTSQC